MTRPRHDPKPQSTEREQKLAQALRANLRRRKAEERPPATLSSEPKSGEEN